MVAADKHAIGYSGIGYLTEGVRTVPLATAPGEKCYDTSPASTYSGKYPLARYLNLYLNKAPAKASRSGDIGIRQIHRFAGWADRNGEERVLSDHWSAPSDGSIQARHSKRPKLKDLGKDRSATSIISKVNEIVLDVRSGAD